MKIPSEPIRKERICQNLTEALGKSWDFRFTIAKQTPPKKKYGGPPFTIVDVTLDIHKYPTTANIRSQLSKRYPTVSALHPYDVRQRSP